VESRDFMTLRCAPTIATDAVAEARGTTRPQISVVGPAAAVSTLINPAGAPVTVKFTVSVVACPELSGPTLDQESTPPPTLSGGRVALRKVRSAGTYVSLSATAAILASPVLRTEIV
jgi:hypothetical protein